MSRAKTNRSELTDNVGGPVGLEFLVRQREIALYEARKRPDFDAEEFDKSYPPYKFDKSHVHIEVKV